MRSPASAPPLLSVFAWLAPVAASLAFVPLMEQDGYVLAAAVLTAGPLAAVVLLRLTGAPPALTLLGQTVAAVAWTTLLYFSDTAVGGMVPTGATVDALVALLGAGVETANAYAAPAPATDGLVFLLAVSVLLCYLLVDGLGVGLGRAPLTGLPLLAIYTVPAALAPDGVPAMAFLPGAAAYLLLLAYDERERLGHWGRQISSITGIGTEHEQRRLNAGALNASAGRVGAVALASAAVLPLFVPVLPEGWLQGGAGGAGDGRLQVTNPIVDLRRELVERSEDLAMLVRTRSDEVDYFRLAALDEFDGERWKFSDRDVASKFDLRAGLVAPPGLDPDVATRSRRFSVDVSPLFHSEWLPAPYAPSRVAVEGVWRYDPLTLDIVAGTEQESAAGRSYAVTTIEALPTFRQLDRAGGAPSTISGRYTEVPDTVPEEVRERAERITAAGGSRFQRAVLLQNWFRFSGGFRYSLAVPEGHSGDDILSFLNNKVGYCEQFAAAMAVMARELDIPARVAVGFLSASPVQDSLPATGSGVRAGGTRTYRYTFADLHAWPELYFEGAGWVRFEPTPAARGAAAPPYTAGDPTDPNQQLFPSEEPTVQPTVPDTGIPRGLDPGTGAGGAAPDASTSPAWYAGGALLLLALLTPALVRVLLRRRRLSAAGGAVHRAEAVWTELRDAMRDLGYDWPVDTPRRTAARVLPLLRRQEAAESALRRLALTVERARFARVPADGSTLEHDLRLVVEVLKARESRWDRVKSVLAPRSLRGAYRRQNRLDSQRFRSLTLDGDASALQAAP